ncbi:hypothetical protein TNCV_834711 [Trichonephila clavipes]|nr:hypothetical protein TNCV_834711 [Trichonephila clavipes]
MNEWVSRGQTVKQQHYIEVLRKFRESEEEKARSVEEIIPDSLADSAKNTISLVERKSPSPNIHTALTGGAHRIDCSHREGLGSNPGEDRDVCKCIVPLRHGGTLNSRRVASPHVWLVEREERWEAPDYPRVSSL